MCGVYGKRYWDVKKCQRKKRSIKKNLSVREKLFAISGNSMRGGTTKTDWFIPLHGPLTNTSLGRWTGWEKNCSSSLGREKKKRMKENDPLINESNCSELIEYIIHRHHSVCTTCGTVTDPIGCSRGKRHAIWLPNPVPC